MLNRDQGVGAGTTQSARRIDDAPGVVHDALMAVRPKALLHLLDSVDDRSAGCADVE